jgi:hypothetical protein
MMNSKKIAIGLFAAALSLGAQPPVDLPNAPEQETVTVSGHQVSKALLDQLSELVLSAGNPFDK